METLELADIQGLVFSRYATNSSACFVLLEITDRAGVGKWLEALAPSLTTGAGGDGPALNLALTARGLRSLGLPESALATFSIEFCEGMAGAAHRSRILGDTDGSDPSGWQWGAAQRPVDAMLLIYAPDDASLATRLAACRSAFAGACREIAVRDTVTLPERKEHFGFADGIAQPTIAGVAPGVAGIKAGEFVFGYANEYDQIPVSPSVPASLDAKGHLAVAVAAAARDFGRNGSYLVVRQLEQDVEGFWDAMASFSRTSSGEVDPAAAVRLAAKCVGRWPSGAPLVKSPDRDDEALRDDDDFMYAKEDPRGLACPIGSHIRRTNPRDSLEPGPAESLVVVNRHRIVRRGRSYGPPLAPFAHETEKKERGLFFMCLNANIRRQFEFIQQTWANNVKFDGLYEDKDPLIGDQPPDGGGTFTIPEVPVRRRLQKLSRFVRVRGGEYFFLPGVRGVRFLGALASGSAVPS